jgi:hypothetical protein
MSARRTAIHIATQAGISMAALFVVGVMLAAIPAHKAATDPIAITQNSGSQESQAPNKPGDKMPGLDLNDAEAGAMREMSPGGHDLHSLHMYMTAPRPQTPADVQRAYEIVAQLRAGMEKYKDYHVALDEGFTIFHPEVPQPEYHFTSHKNGFLEAFNFDASRPTSLLYKKTATGYDLVGAMYTMPKRATEDQLNARIPLSIASWHLHTNLCFPAHGEGRAADLTKFGFHGSIVTQEACDAAGGRFLPTVFGWMVHVYPYEDGIDKIFAMHNHLHAD